MNNGMQSTYLPFCSVERVVASTTSSSGPSPIEALRLPAREVENAPIIPQRFEAILRMPVDSDPQSEYNQELRSLIDDLKSQPLCVLRDLRRIRCEGQENSQIIDERRKLHHFLDREVLTSIAEECFTLAGLPFENEKSALVDFEEEDGSGTWTLINGEHAICISVSSDNDTAELVRINPITYTAGELVYPTYPDEGSSLQEVATSSKTYTRAGLEAILQRIGNIVSEPERYSGARLVGGNLGAIVVGSGADSDMECQIIRNSTERDEHLSFHLNDGSLLNAACSEEGKVVSGTVDGPCISLCGLGANNIYHWFNDILPQLIRAEDMDYTGKYIIPEGPPYVEESLRLLNIPEERLHRFSSGVLAVQGELLVLDRIQAKEPGSPYSALMHTLRTRIEGELESAVSDELKNQIAELTQDGERPLMLHIVRRPNGNMENARFPTNYEALEATLDNQGFIAVDMAKLKLADQIYIASKADVLAGPHGAGFTHCMWLKKGAQIIEFFGDSYHLDCFEDLAKVFDLKYARVTGPASEYGWSAHRSFHVPIDEVIEKLNAKGEM